MSKKICSLFLILLLAAGSTLNVCAEDYVGGNGWYVQFTGEKMESNFKASDITDEISKLQPGDSVTINIRLENQGTNGTDWYMTNEVLSSLEDSQSAANGGAYAYWLSYTDSQGEETVLYSSENVGGEKRSAAGEGLHEATDNLEEFFYLDRLEPGKSGIVTLKVVLDGETQGNTYQNTLASLQMNFAVEKTGTVPGPDGSEPEGGKPDGSGDQDTPGAPGGNTPRTSGPGAYTLHSVRTGDPSNMILWSAIALGSGAAMLMLAAWYMKKEKGGSNSE